MDLAEFESRYWREIEAAKFGDRAPLLAKLREGVEPTRVDLSRLADFLEYKAHRGRPKNPKGATRRLQTAATDPREKAFWRYREIMEDLKARGEARGKQDQVKRAGLSRVWH